ncbi:hypothetical protein GCM10009557_06120 [Virgisporangium ochraceum]|uniref:DUF2303 family protein n=1 Tax=Virgisporangium ochraceum TaxID=65505 RepID=A0A8J4E9F6_9ACTN|nr:DUF2303 family protein [Virgisporangium ochraceum]GIJ66268.1 hypothetical protein Voc01_011850 [Virgisporangium ochraceum]
MTLDASFIDQLTDVVRDGAIGQELTRGELYAFRLGDKVQVVDLTTDQYRDVPARKTGTVHVRDVGSFVAYWAKHSTKGVSEVYADRGRCTVTAVLDAHATGIAGWGEHRLVLTLVHSSALTAWLGADGRLMPQEQFAEFLDDNRADIHSPSAAEMLEIAQTLEGTTKVDWQAGHRIADGQRRIGFVETSTARAGQKGELAIPTVIQVAVPVFEGAEQAHVLEARFRHRIEGGALKLGFKLARPQDVITSAFDHALGELGEACDATVLRGTPVPR